MQRNPRIMPILDTFITGGKWQRRYKENRWPHEKNGLQVFRPGDMAYFQHKQHRYYCKVIRIHETRVRKYERPWQTEFLLRYLVQIINN